MSAKGTTTAGSTAKRSTATRTVKSLGKSGNFSVRQIRSAVEKVTSKR